MADYTRQLKKLLSEKDCTFIRHDKGDHDIMVQPYNRPKCYG